MTTDELLIAGPVPRWEVPQWRERFGLVAGITGRGDDPSAPFDLGLWTDRPVRDVMRRWTLFRATFPQCPALLLAHQIHGDRVLWHDAVVPGWTIVDGADGHATAASGLMLLVTVADCVPVYLVAPQHGAIALLHAGWRGTAAGVLDRGVEMLRAQVGAEPADLVCHLGVGISGAQYEVGAEVMAGVGRGADGPGPWHIDLREILTDQATKLGLGETTVSGHCTARDADRFFSHRRSGGRDGRMVAYLGMGRDP